MIKYVGRQGIENLKNYKYHGVDLSIASKWMQPWWTFFVEQLPKWLAPNLITLIGFGFIVAGYLSTLSCGLELKCVESEAPRLMYLFSAFCLFVYQTMDAVDGKQARRTGSSSPLGELFDHGCDAMTTTLLILQLGTIISYGGGLLMFPVSIFMLGAFYLAQWEEYFTDTLVLGKFSVTEAQLMTMANFLVPFFFGPEWWVEEHSLLGLFSIRRNSIFITFTVTTLVITCATNVQHVLAHCQKKRMSFASTVPRALPLIVLGVLFGIWFYYSPTDIATHHPHLFVGSMGFLNAGLVGRMVVCRVCGLNFSPLQPILLVPLTALVASFLGFVPEFTALLLVYLFSISSYLFFAWVVIDEMTSALGIYCLRIRPKSETK